MPFNLDEMDAQLGDADIRTVADLAKVCTVVISMLIVHMNTLERRIEALKQKQPPIKIQEGTRTI